MGSFFIISCQEGKEKVNDHDDFLLNVFAKFSNLEIKLKSSSSIKAFNERDGSFLSSTLGSHGYNYIQSIIQQLVTFGLV
jgi:hypothetical protein